MRASSQPAAWPTSSRIIRPRSMPSTRSWRSKGCASSGRRRSPRCHPERRRRRRRSRGTAKRWQGCMKIDPLKIGSISIWPPIVLAPMSGVTNRTLRALYKPFGFGLTVTEFVSSNALQYGAKRTMEMIDQHGVERPVSTQLWGNDPAVMAYAAKVVRECGADIVDINFGCPAPRVTKTEGGSACLRDVDRCEAIMRAVVGAVDCPVTVKMRLGWTDETHVYLEVARRAQAVGVQAVTLHARTAKQFYKGSADWSKIAELKRAVDIPVIGNGDLSDAHDAFRRMRETGVDALMLGRAVLGNPWLVGRLRALMEGREPEPIPDAPERLAF